MQPNKPKENNTPTPKLTVHGSAHVKWYFQCSHRCIGRPMLAKAWFTNSTAVRTSKQERYNDEDRHTPSLNASTEHKWVQAHGMQSMDLPWCCVTLHAYVKHMHILDYDFQANEINKYNLCCARVLVMQDSSNAWAMGSCSSSGGSMICVGIDLQCIQMSDEEPRVIE